MHKREFFEYKAVLTPFLSKNKVVSKRLKALCMRNSCTPMLCSIVDKKAGKTRFFYCMENCPCKQNINVLQATADEKADSIQFFYFSS